MAETSDTIPDYQASVALANRYKAFDDYCAARAKANDDLLAALDAHLSTPPLPAESTPDDTDTLVDDGYEDYHGA